MKYCENCNEWYYDCEQCYEFYLYREISDRERKSGSANGIPDENFWQVMAACGIKKEDDR